MKHLRIVLSLALMISVIACGKPGPGGKASITISTKANQMTAVGATVYIKYDAVSSPGTSADVFDDVSTSNIQGEAFFTNLHKGDYFIYATYGDTSLLTGTGAINITEKKGNIFLQIEVQ